MQIPIQALQRCKKCHKALTWKEQVYNPVFLCDDCLQKEEETFKYKGSGNDESTRKEDS